MSQKGAQKERDWGCNKCILIYNLVKKFSLKKIKVFLQTYLIFRRAQCEIQIKRLLLVLAAASGWPQLPRYQVVCPTGEHRRWKQSSSFLSYPPVNKELMWFNTLMPSVSYLKWMKWIERSIYIPYIAYLKAGLSVVFPQSMSLIPGVVCIFHFSQSHSISSVFERGGIFSDGCYYLCVCFCLNLNCILL